MHTYPLISVPVFGGGRLVWENSHQQFLDPSCFSFLLL